MDLRWKAGLVSLLVSFFLILQFSPAVQASSYSVTVSASVEEPLSGTSDEFSAFIVAGKACSITITVTNNGDSVDNYVLEVIEAAGWSMELQENRWTNVGPGESRTTTLNITAPEDVEIGLEDNIMLRAIGSAGAEDNFLCRLGVLRADVTDWSYVATGVGVVVVAIIIVLVLWKGGL